MSAEFDLMLSSTCESALTAVRFENVNEQSD